MDSKNKKTSPLSSPTPTTTTTATSTTAPMDLNSICDQAVLLAKAADFSKAHSLIDDHQHLYNFSALFHHSKAAIHHLQAQYQEAIASALKARDLAPSDLGYSFFLARTLIFFMKQYEEGFTECKRALSITHPIVSYSRFLDIEVNASAENRITCFQGKIRLMLKLSHDAILDPQPLGVARQALLIDSPMPEAAQHKKKLVRSKNSAEEHSKARARSYLKSLTPESIQDLLRIDVADIKNYYSFSEDASILLSESLQFANAWKFWICSVCDQEFANSNSHLDHVLEDHVENLSVEKKSYFPTEVDQDWADKLVSGSWEPIDLEATGKLLQEMPGSDEWLLSNDQKRIKILQDIGAMFHMLVKNNYLTKNHLSAILRSATHEVQKCPSACLLLKHRVNDQSTVCIRMLDSPRLLQILDLLQYLTDTCNSGKFSEKDSMVSVEYVPDSEAVNRISFSLSKLILDPQVFCEFSGRSAHNSSADDVLRINDEESLTDGVVSWLYKGVSLDESISAWTQLKKTRAVQSDRILQTLKNEFVFLTKLLDKKLEIQNYMEAIITVERFYVESNHESRESVLRTKKEEIAKELALKKVKAEIDPGLNAVVAVISNALEEEKSRKSDVHLDVLMNNVFTKLRYSTIKRLLWVDARLMITLAKAREVEASLGHAASLDYLTVLDLLVKSFLKVVIEKEAKEFAIERAKAASEALLAELDAENRIVTGADHLKQTKDKSKGKTKMSKKSKGRKF